MQDPTQVTGFDNALAALCDRRLVQSMYGECDILMKDVLLTLHGEQHARRRAVELQLFRKDFARYYEHAVLPDIVAHTLAPYLEQGSVDLPDFGARVTLNLSARIAGLDIKPVTAATEDTELLLSIVRKFGEGATLFHSTRDKSEVRTEVAQALAVFNEVFLQPAWERRLALIEASAATEDEATLPRDILTVLLSHQAEQGWDDALIRREVAFFMQAASHSSATALVHAFHEITSWCGSDPGRRQRLIDDPLFLQRSVHESLRLHPASPVAWRVSDCPFTFSDGNSVAAGDAVVVALQDANRDPAVFGADADHFDPHRRLQNRTAPYGLTFGVGVHTCFGRELAGGSLPEQQPSEGPQHLGTLTRILHKLFSSGAQPDPDHPPERATDTLRANWARYPIRLGVHSP